MANEMGMFHTSAQLCPNKSPQEPQGKGELLEAEKRWGL